MPHPELQNGHVRGAEHKDTTPTANGTNDYYKPSSKGSANNNRAKRSAWCRCWHFQQDFIDRPLRSLFSAFGRYIGHHPYPFLILPLVISACLSLGLKYFEIETDTEYLVTPKNGPAKLERRIVQKHFSLDASDEFLPNRSPHLDGFADVIIANGAGDNILTPSGLNIALEIDEYIRHFVTEYEDDLVTFDNICSRWESLCIKQPILSMFLYNASRANHIQLQYPYHSHIFIGQSLGQVELTKDQNNNNVVAKAKAMRLMYYVKYQSEAQKIVADVWFKDMLNALQVQFSDKYEGIKIYCASTNSLTQQFDEASKDIMPKFAAPLALLITFSVLSCMMSDWVRSKPWLALLGVTSASLALVSTFGLLSALGTRAVPQVGLVPFLTLGVGVDNMFILISAWRRSIIADQGAPLTLHERVASRMSLAMREAALSITITSLTDVLAFSIGAITDFPTVELFCLYTGLAIIFSYIYCITFFAACMVLSGWREEAHRHCFVCVTVAKDDEVEQRHFCYKLWCMGVKAIGPRTDEKLEVAEDHLVMRFFRDHFGPMLMKPWVKVFVLLWYAVYLIIALYGCMNIRAGVSFEKLSNTDSYLAHYYQMCDKYFNRYGPTISVVIDQPMDYFDPLVQNQVDDLLTSFGREEPDYFYTNDSSSWLQTYQLFLNMTRVTPRTSQEFVQYLKSFLGTQRFHANAMDVAFNKNGTQVIASRFYLQTRWAEKMEEMMLAARRVTAANNTIPATAFQQSFVYFDQPIAVLPNTLQNIGIAVGCMFAVALLLVPNPLCAIWVTMAIASIVCGVLGYMTLWDVNVDFISMTYLILCIGFSVDFAVHITYGFISSSTGSSKEKAIQGLYLLGYPILQSATSTVISVVFLCTSISYLFLSFFKTMILVIIFGTWHSLFVLPVVLSLVSGLQELPRTIVLKIRSRYNQPRQDKKLASEAEKKRLESMA